MCFELRTYHAADGKLDALNARFRNHTLALFEKHGITNLGYWVPQQNDGQVLIYLLAYPDKAAREASWKAFLADPVWQAAKAESEKEGKLVAKVESRFLHLTDYSPHLPLPDSTAPARLKCGSTPPCRGNSPPSTRASGITRWLCSKSTG